MGVPPIFVILVTFFQDFANFGRKPKWPVWSIRTTFKGWDWKLEAQKVSHGRKLKFWRGGEFQNSVLRSREGFSGFLQDQT